MPGLGLEAPQGQTLWPWPLDLRSWPAALALASKVKLGLGLESFIYKIYQHPQTHA